MIAKMLYQYLGIFEDLSSCASQAENEIVAKLRATRPELKRAGAEAANLGV